MIKVLIADDHPFILKGLFNIIRDEPDMEIAAEASNGVEAIQMIKDKDLDVAVIDINMPCKSGLDVIKHIKSSRSKLPVLILSVHPEEQYATRVIKNGASGYMTKESAPNELIGAIRKIHSGGKYMSPQVASKLLDEINNGFDDEEILYKKLSEREYQIFILLAKGLKVGEISSKLKISVKTVATYRQRLLEKMNMTNNAQLTKYAYEMKLI